MNIRRTVSLFLCLCLLWAGLALSEGAAPAWYDDENALMGVKVGGVKEGADVSLRVMTVRYTIVGGDADKQWIWRFLRDEFNLTLQVEQVMSDALSERKNLMFAADSLPDIMIGLEFSASELLTYGDIDGQLLPLDEYIPRCATAPDLKRMYAERPEVFSNLMTPAGHIYSLPTVRPFWTTLPPIATYINEVWLEELGLDMPETLDEFVDAMRAIKAGKGDAVIPLGGCFASCDPSGHLINALGFNNRAASIMSVAVQVLPDGSEVAAIPALTERFTDYVTLMKTLYDEGLIEPEFFTMNETQVNANADAGKYAILTSAPYTKDTVNWRNYAAAKPLTSEYRATPAWSAGVAVSQGQFVISADCANIDAALMMGNFGYNVATESLVAGQGPVESLPESWYDGEYYGRAITDTEPYYVLSLPEGKDSWTWMNESWGNNSWAVNVELLNEANLLFFPNEHATGDTGDKLADAIDHFRRSYEASGETNGDNYYRLRLFEGMGPYFTDRYFPTIAYFDQEATVAMSDLSAALGQYVSQALAEFVTGIRSLDTLDQYYADIEALGAARLQQYYADYYREYLANKG